MVGRLPGGGARDASVDGPRARRLQRPGWRDGRLIVGVLLVLASVVLGARVVAAAKETSTAYVAVRDLSPGEAVHGDDLRPVDVRLGGLAQDYVAEADPLHGAARAVQAVRAGQLVPRSALGTGEQAAQRQVSLPVPAGSAEALVRGTAVEVWVSERSTQGGADVYGTPVRVVGAGTVARDPEQSASLTGGSATVNLQVWVPSAVVPDLLAAVDARDRVTAVPLPGAVLRSAG